MIPPFTRGFGAAAQFLFPHVELEPETVTWAAFGMERDYDADNVGLAQFADVGPFHFLRSAYESLLRAQLDRFSALAQS